MTSPSPPGGSPVLYRQDNDDNEVVHRANLYGGAGTIEIKHFLRGEGHAEPALLMTYAIPPGASEGVHTHRPGDAAVGSYDEFYYVVSGSGQMRIADDVVQVKAGDHVFVPNEVPHGIENTSESTVLKLFLVAMIRG